MSFSRTVNAHHLLINCRLACQNSFQIKPQYCTYAFISITVSAQLAKPAVFLICYTWLSQWNERTYSLNFSHTLELRPGLCWHTSVHRLQPGTKLRLLLFRKIWSLVRRYCHFNTNVIQHCVFGHTVLQIISKAPWFYYINRFLFVLISTMHSHKTSKSKHHTP